MTDMKSIPAMSFKCTCVLNAISNESGLLHFALGKFCSHENPMLVSYRFEFYFASHMNILIERNYINSRCNLWLFPIVPISLKK